MKAKIEAAAKAKQALSRGKEFEEIVKAGFAPGGSLAGMTLPPRVTTMQQKKAWYYSQIRSVIADAETAK